MRKRKTPARGALFPMEKSPPDMKNGAPGSIRKVGVVLFCLALLATVLGGFHVIENWRGKKKWEAYKRKLIADGAKLDLAAFVPPPIPDAKNFAATPFFADLLPRKPTNWNERYWPETFSHYSPPSGAGKRNERHVTDFGAWRRVIRGETNGPPEAGPGDRAKAAEEVLAMLKMYEPALRELRAASDRPLSRYNIEYTMDNPWGIFLPHLPVIKETTKLLSVKACAELAMEKSDRAMDDIRLMARISNSMDTELFLINYLVHVACFQIMLQPVWEGLALNQWSDAQLEELQRIMLRFNFVAELSDPMAAERAAGILTADIILKQGNKMELINALFNPEQTGRPGKASLGNFVAGLVPRGWYYLEQYNCARLFQEFVMPGFDGTNRLIYPALSDANHANLEKALESQHPILDHVFLAKAMIPSVTRVHHRAAEAQTAAHQAAIACALERYRRKHGDYPADLGSLAPEFLKLVPHDVVGGKPMHYKASKPIAVYSVGWDETDNGGTPGKTLWDARGDWVWTYPQTN